MKTTDNYTEDTNIISRFSGKLKKSDMVNILFICVFSIYISTNVLEINIGHVLAIAVVIVFLILKNETIRDDSENFLAIVEFKMNSLSLNNQTVPEYMYIDPEMITLFYELKESLSKFNEDSYSKALKCVGAVLEIRYDSERKLCEEPETPDLSYNGDQSTFDSGKAHHLDILNNIATPTGLYSFKNNNDTSVCNNTLDNIYENYQEAEKQGKRAINYIHSLIINIPSHSVYHSLHEKLLNRFRVLIYRNLDIIKSFHDKSLKIKGLRHNTHFINDIGLPKSYEKNVHNDTFNFF